MDGAQSQLLMGKEKTRAEQTGKHEGNGTLGRPRRKWEGNDKTYVNKTV
jgi:hypothetical protein